jgi:putative transcriptional regulator
MVQLEIKGNEVIITKNANGNFWALKNEMTIPIKNIKSASIAEKISHNIGTNQWGLYSDDFSFDYNGGAFLQNEEKIYWDIDDITKIIQIEFKSGTKLIIEASDPQTAVRNIRAAIIDYENKKTGLAEIRKSRKVTQEELANAIGVSRQTIISLENRKYTASLPLAFKISKYFDMKVEDLFADA